MPRSPKSSKNKDSEAKTIPSRIVRLKGAAGRILLLFLAPFLILESFFFAEVLKNYNYLEVFPREFIFPTLMHAVTALIIALAIQAIRRPVSIGPKLVSAGVLGLFMAGYNDRLLSLWQVYKAFLPILPKPEDEMLVISLLLMASLLVLAVLAGILVERAIRKYQQIDSKAILYGVAIFVGFIFLSQLVRIVNIMPEVSRQSSMQAALPESKSPKGQPAAQKPDIYYLVFDRYANGEVLKNQFNFDNSSFTGFLKKNDFQVNNAAYANYPYTTMSVASTLNGFYTKDQVAPFVDNRVQTRTLYHNLNRQSPFIKELQKNGYDYHHVGSWYGASNQAPLAKEDYVQETSLNLLGKKILLRGVEKTQFTASPYNELARSKSELPRLFQLTEYDRVDMLRRQLKALDKVADEKNTGGRFILGHILVPHEPFSFNADGSISIHDGGDSYGKPVKTKYIDQVKFINKEIQDLVTRIRKNSNNQAVIILNADEGPYPSVMNDTLREPVDYEEAIKDGVIVGDMRDWSDDWLKMKFGIQQAVHIPKATEEDKANMSSANIMRVVLNRYFGHKLDYLPDCQYGLTKGSHEEFVYADITPRFNTNADPRCESYATVHSKK